jgi:uncharacterized membrane protein YdbT with pleckstrin-like domain
MQAQRREYTHRQEAAISAAIFSAAMLLALLLTGADFVTTVVLVALAAPLGAVVA